ncbi:unnamed protein product [Adineta steineri]|uniref:HEPN domain-containing protein n=1 Tax=Adineta steineri TaxID=433720 RepID=A0A814QQY7_9BILA|nr:unnamed protein product [Adineta steineri]CAF4186837.1 unnamed protein product [Adineta steineri]
MFDFHYDLCCRIARDIAIYYKWQGEKFYELQQFPYAHACFSAAKQLLTRANKLLQPEFPFEIPGLNEMLISALQEKNLAEQALSGQNAEIT